MPDQSRPLTAAQLALHRAAEAVARRDGAPPIRAEAEQDRPLAPTPDPPSASSRRQRPSRLLELDELYVGRPGVGQPFAYRDRNQEVVADVHVLELSDESKVGALLSGEATDHVDERWLVVEQDEPIFYVERYRPADEPSYAVFDPEGGHLATFLDEGGFLHHTMTVREGASAPAAAISVHDHRHVLTEPDGRELGWCWRAFSAVGNGADDEVWGLRVERDPALLDRRAVVAAPLVCHFTSFQKRRIDPDSELAVLLVITVPPVGLAVAAVERAIDGLYWLRRRLD